MRAMGSYKFPDTLADRTGSQICHCEEAAGRRGALSAKREEVPLGCNLGKAVTFSPEVPNYPAKYCEISPSLRSSEWQF